MKRGIAVFLLAVACGGGGTTQDFCERYLRLFDDLQAGNVPTFEEFQSRIAPESLGDPGGLVGDSYDRLLSAIERGDEETALDETFYLEELCFDVVHG